MGWCSTLTHVNVLTQTLPKPGTSQKLPPCIVMNPDATEKEEEEEEKNHTHTSSSRLSDVPVM